MKNQHRHWFAAALAATALIATGCSGGGGSGEPGTYAEDQGDVQELVEAAKEEGTVTWFTEYPEAIVQSAINGFREEFGIEVEYISQNTPLVMQRYQTEADSGTLSADLITVSNSTAFFEDSIANGWGMPLADAELPVFELGTYPEEYLQGDVSATMGLLPFLMLYNGSTIEEDMIPEDFGDLTDPKYKNELVLVDPTTSDAWVGFYDMLLNEYGEEWFEGVMDNNPKFFPAVSAGAQAMVAGEGTIKIPAAKAVWHALQQNGAPVEYVTPPVTTGPAINLMLTDSELAPHPNAAKLFANWLLSESGNLTAQGDIGASVYDEEAVPEGFVQAREITPEIRNKIVELFGM